MTTADLTPSIDIPRRRRAIVVVALAAVVAAAVALAVARTPSASDASTQLPLVAVPNAGAESVAWYCAAGSATDNGPSDETLVLTNVGAAPTKARVSVYSGVTKAPPAVLDVTVKPYSQKRVRVLDVAKVAEPGVTVDARGGQLVVEHLLTANGDVAAGPCTRRASADWYLPNGTTAKGYEQSLAVFNPFPDEAVVDATFFTEEGVKRPEELTGLAIPPRSRVTIAVHEAVRRNDIVATRLQARTGRVVVERTQLANGSEGPKGISLMLGRPELATSFTLPEAIRNDKYNDRVIVFNPSDAPTSVQSTVQLRSDLSFSPIPTEIPPRTAMPVRLPEGLPADVPYSLAVRVTGAQPVAIEQSVVFSGPSPWLASIEGETTVAAKWAVGLARIGANDTVVIANPGPDAVSVQVQVTGNGRAPRTVTQVDVAGGRSANVALTDPAVGENDSVIVTANAGVTVFRVDRAGATRSAAVPFPG